MLNALTITADPVTDPTPAPTLNIVETANGGMQVTPGAPAATPERPTWLPEKFKTPEDMAKAYGELETKLGTPKTSPVPTPAPVVAPTDAEKVAAAATSAAVAKAGLDMAALSAEYVEKGTLSAESLAALEKSGVSQETVNEYIKGQQAVAAQQRADIAATVGGEETLKSILTWANVNLEAGDKATYNAALATGNTDLIKLAMANVNAKFTAANGKQPALITGAEVVTASGDYPAFASNAQMIKAMQDKRYATDPAYREGIARRIANTP